MNVLLYNMCAVFLLFHLVNLQNTIKSVGKINKCTVKFEDTDICACSNDAMKKKIIVQPLRLIVATACTMIQNRTSRL